MNISEYLQAGEEELFPIFFEIDSSLRQNLRRVINAFRHHRVGVHHFSGVTGYGHDDLGRETLDKVFAEVMGAEAAAVRVQFVSGTHAIACALFGALRPGDEMLSVAGPPYDTLEEVIGLREEGQGSLKEFGISYRELPLTETGTINWQGLKSAVTEKTRLALIQRSCGYSWRASLSISDIEKIVKIVKQQNPETVCFVDNCYGEFIEDQEPTVVGAD